MKTTILLVEDDIDIINLSKPLLEAENFNVLIAMSIKFGTEIVKTQKIDIIILDLMLPDGDGSSFLKWLKFGEKYFRIPVIVISAKSSEIDKVVLLELGADDYVTKPFSIRELISRIRVVLKRYASGSEKIQNSFIEEGLEVNFSARKVYIDGKEVNLPKKEFEILELLINNKNIVIQRDDIITSIWGYDSDITSESRIIDVHVSNIRKKLGKYKNRIKTLKGVGFRFE